MPLAASTSCTQLIQDDHVFVVLAPLMPDCYLQDGVPGIQAVLAGAAPPGVAQNFSLSAPATAYDPLQLSIYKKIGAFKNKKVGIFAGETTDEAELKFVQTALANLHVNVVQTAVDSATGGPPGREWPGRGHRSAVPGGRGERGRRGRFRVLHLAGGTVRHPEHLQPALDRDQ